MPVHTASNGAAEAQGQPRPEAEGRTGSSHPGDGASTGLPAQEPAVRAATEPPPGPLREGFRTAQARGLNRDHTALRLWRKAKRLGIWNPDDLDFTQDVEDWQGLSEPKRELLLQLANQFLGGEEAVTLDLLPLLRAVAEDGYFEDELFLTAFLFEEAKHVDFFHRFLQEMTGGERPDGHAYYGDHYRCLFFDELPRAMQRLRTDASPVRQAEAVVVYNMIVEGMVAETGYYLFYNLLRTRGILPGTIRGIQLVQQDEARHLRYAVYLLERLIAEHGEPVYEAFRSKMEALLPVVHGMSREGYARLAKQYGHAEPAVSALRNLRSLEFTQRQYEKRLARIERARGRPLEEILYRTTIEPDLTVDAAPSPNGATPNGVTPEGGTP